jgi:hypothetical protein
MASAFIVLGSLIAVATILYQQFRTIDGPTLDRHLLLSASINA